MALLQFDQQRFPPLKLPLAALKLRQADKGIEVFDVIRLQYVYLTPEEWVRQHVIHYLLDHRHCPKGLMGVEQPVMVNKMRKRTDIVVYDRQAQPLMLVECKAPAVPITQQTFRQIWVYHTSLKVSYLLLSNGLTHYCCRFDAESKQYHFIDTIPDYHTMLQDARRL